MKEQTQNQPSVDSSQFSLNITRKRTKATTQNKNTAEYLIKEIDIHHFVILKKFNFTDGFLLFIYILI